MAPAFTNPSLPRLLITGASGFLGWHLCCQARKDWQVFGTFRTHPTEISGVSCRAIDLTDKAVVREWLQELQPDAVIHTAALSKPNQCEQEPELSFLANVDATRNLAEFCGKHQIPLVFTSTEQVFNGQSAPYLEIDPPSPINVYGRHKVEAEGLIQALHPGAIICRMPLMYGPSSPTADSFVQGFIQTLKAQKLLPLFEDEYRCPAYVEDAARGLLLALEKGTGILHLGGPERISRYAFGLLLAEVFDLDANYIRRCYQKDVSMPAARPGDLTTRNDRAYAIGYSPRNVRDGLISLRHGMETSAPSK
jgi:dTDP-4-dehydrorhamnose reductase